MTFYLDSSFVVAILSTEPSSLQARAWVRSRSGSSLAVSRWSITEVASAIAKKVRMQVLTLEERDDVMHTWDMFRQLSLETVDVDADCFATAASYAGRSELSLRAGDALHLAVASRSGMHVVTLDRMMANACRALSIPVETP